MIREKIERVAHSSKGTGFGACALKSQVSSSQSNMDQQEIDLNDAGDWNDEALIEAYSRAVSQLQHQNTPLTEESQKASEMQRPALQPGTSSLSSECTYSVGELVMAKHYPGDRFYRGLITKIEPCCVEVKFLRDGAVQRTRLQDTYPDVKSPPSTKPHYQSESGEISSDDECYSTEQSTKPQAKNPDCHLGSADANLREAFERLFDPKSPCSDKKSMKNDALLSMLSSWYMSGYYTGFFKGLEAAKEK